MLSYLAKRAIGAFERRWAYDGSYMREIIERSGFDAIRPLDALGKVAKYRRDVPVSVYYAAKITAAIAADCGPCAQLIVSIAEAEGVVTSTLHALVAGDRAALTEDERLGFDLAQTTLAREPGDTVRAAILERFGHRGLVSLAYGLVSAQAFPTFKYAVGYGHACTRIRVDGAELPRGWKLPA
jgi:hypothetical protein